MPNWVTNRIIAPSHVIKAMLNDQGKVDFATIAPFPGPHNEWGGIYSDAEQAAEILCGIPLNTNPLIASLEATNRSRFDVRKLSDASFSQFVGMMENYRACGYLHSMEFARKMWGTKWNARESTVNLDEGKASFDTAWSCPEGALVELSKRFPEDIIKVVYADEDIGSNCGSFSLKAGEIVDSDIAPRWRDMTDEQKAKWKTFAYEVKGWTPEEEEYDV